MSLEITRQLQGDEVVSKTDADSSYLTIGTNQTISGAKSFDSDIAFLNRHRLNLKKDTSTDVLSIYPGSSNDNAYVEAKTGELVLSGSVINVNNKRIVGLADPQSQNHAATKYYVDTNCVRTTGDQNIGGNKNFTGSITTSGLSLNNNVYITNTNYGFDFTGKFLKRNGNDLNWDGSNLVTQSYANSNYQTKLKYVDYGPNDMTWKYTRGQRYMEQYHFFIGGRVWDKGQIINVEWQYNNTTTDENWHCGMFTWYVDANTKRLRGIIWDAYDPHNDTYEANWHKYSSFRVWYK